ncbi:MAG TPA: pectinesterase family protein, partial [Bacteroidota bacterium]|nr:pectinesterase family protein [Bacteroidota bacterium]
MNNLKRSLPVLAGIFIALNMSFGQSDSIVWRLIVPDSIYVSSVTSGLAGQDESFHTLNVNNYAGPGTPTSQRVTINGGAWTAATSQNDTVFIQFAVSPAAGHDFTVDAISLLLGASGGGSMKANIWYSTDPTFVSRTQLASNLGFTNGSLTALSYTPTVTVNNGQTFYFRIYPWYTSSSTGKYICPQNLVISGTTTSTSTPGLTVLPTALTFPGTGINTSSIELTYSLTGSSLTPSSGSITVTAPSAFAVSLTSGSGYSSFVSVPYSSGTISSTPIYVIFNPTVITTYTGTITNTGGGATEQDVSVSGTGSTAAGIFVSTTGSDANPGTFELPFQTLGQALTVAGPGSSIFLRAGIYSSPSATSADVSGASGRYITISPYTGESATLDYSSEPGTNADGLSVSGSYIHVMGLEVTGAAHNGINVSGHYNILENCRVHDNRNSGIQMGSQSGTKFPRGNLFLNCDSYRNYDQPVGGNGDGFAIKWNIGSGNIFKGCRSWNNSDDGWDFWMADSTIEVDSCWAFSNGIDLWHSGSFDGNGNGFKMGGNNVATPHVYKNCVSFGNALGQTNASSAGKGFDENNNLAGQTLYNCTSFNNKGYNFSLPNTVTLGSHTVRNCLSYVSQTGLAHITSGTVDHNSWQGFTVTNADFLSLDTSLARAPRNADGSLPTTNLFRLAASSPLIDAGFDVGLPYFGMAPDLGAFESPTSVTYAITASGDTTHGMISPYGLTNVGYGASQVYTVTPKTGYHTTDVLVDGSSIGAVPAYTFTGVNAPHTISATFSINQYTITASGDTTNGTIVPYGVTNLSYGDSVVYTIAPRSGYAIANVVVDSVSIGPTPTYTFRAVSANHTISASFAVSGPMTFRSHASGNWSNPNTWDAFNGSQWVNPAPHIPVSTDGVITIQAGHTIIFDTTCAVDQVTVNTTAALVVAAGKTLTVADGADSIDLVVNGVLNEFGTVTATGRISIESGGQFTYSIPGGGSTMPSCTWRNGSTCRIDSTSGNSPTNLNTQNLFNLIWNGTTMAANGGPSFADGAIIAGDVTVLSSKGLQLRLVSLNGGQTKTVTIAGNLNISGSTALVTSTGSGADTLAKAIINIGGNVNVTAGQWSLNNSSSAYAEWRVSGNVSVTGGTLQSGSSGWAGRRTLTFLGGGTQSFTVSSPGTIGTAATAFKVSNNSNVQLNFPWTIMANGILNLDNGQILTSSSNSLTLPASASILGGSATAYINGPLGLTIATKNPTVKTFPIGKGTAYRPVTLTINQDTSTATLYTAEVLNSTPPVRTLPGALNSVSSTRFYTVSKGAGANISPLLGATVQLSYDVDDQVANATLLRIAKDDSAGANWINLGGSGTANTTGSIISNAFYSFSNFVLATADTGTHAVVPTLSTLPVTSISTTFASSGGNVTNDGGAAVTARGMCWNTTGTPTILDATTSDGTGSGMFTSFMNGLAPGTTYHARAYATNSAGTGYGNETVFAALASIIPPTVTTAAISTIQVTTAVSGGTVTDWGGDSVTARGICWNTSGNPTLSDSHTSDGSGMGSFISGLAQLTGGSVYHVRAYATNSSGTEYGADIPFTTAIPQSDTTVIVSKDGSGNYTTVQAAFRDVPNNYTGHWTIFVRKGVYYEKDTLTSSKVNVILQGENRDSTIITYDDYADRYGSGNPGTSGSFTIAIDASDFIAKDITFRNTYSPQTGVTGTQAVALRTQGDRHQYINCKILGYQDTYYTWGGSGAGRMYHRDCFIEGTVDFIFGRNIVVFDNCTIHEIRNGGTLTAGSTDATSRYGYIFRNCTILADSIGYDGNPNTSFYLGRPWQASPRTVFINTSEPFNLNAGGWESWNVTPALYAEFNCYGPGSSTAGRVTWSSQLTGPSASTYSLSNIFSKNSAVSNLILYDWMPSYAANDLPLPMRLTASSGPHGSITPPGVTNVGYNGSQNYSITPSSGYHVSNVLVDTSSVGAVTNYTISSVVANHTITGTFAPNTFTLNVTAVHGTVAKSPDLPQYDSSTAVQLTPTPAVGYHFTGWSGDGSGNSIPLSVIMNGNKNVTANFAVNTYAITLADTNGTITKNPDQPLYDYHSSVQLTAVPATGYRFIGWSGAISGAVNPVSVFVDSAMIISAHFSVIQSGITVQTNPPGLAYTVDGTPYATTQTFNWSFGSNHTIAASSPQSGMPGVQYVWNAWSDGGTQSHVISPITDTTFTASFTTQYQLFLAADSGGMVAAVPPSVQWYDAGSAVQIKAMPDTGFSFTAWRGGGASSYSGTNNPDTIVMNSPVYDTAGFAVNRYSITSSVIGGNGSISPSGVTSLAYGGSQIYVMTPSTGYHIDSIFIDNIYAGNLSPDTLKNVTQPHTITVKFKIDSFIVTSSVIGGNGTITPSGTTNVVFGTDQIYVMTPNTGYHIDSVYIDNIYAGHTSPDTLKAVTSAHTITVKFKIDSFTITSSVLGGNGTITPLGATVVTYGGSQSYVMTPNVGNHIDSIFIDGIYAGKTSPDTIQNVTADHTIAVKFAIDTFTLTVNVVGSGSVTVLPNQTLFNYG